MKRNKKVVKIVFLAALLLGFAFGGCKKQELYSVDYGFNYFPVAEGHYQKYKVTEIFHDIDLNPQHDTFQYILKTKIGEVVLDNWGRKAQKLFRYSYDIDTEELIDQRVWKCIVADNRFEVVEENQRRIRGVFPVKENKDWDANAFNPEGEMEAYYKTVDEPFVLENFLFDSTAFVQYEDYFTLVDYRKNHEVYAKNVGLVERKFRNLTIQNFDSLDIQKGTEVFYELIDYGVEDE